MTNKKVLITGGAGYIGVQLTNALIAQGNQVIVVDNFSNSQISTIDPRVKLYELNILDEKILEVIQKENPEMIFHLAASKDVNASVENPTAFAKINVLGSINVINSAYKAGVKKIVFTSTAGVYGNGEQGVAQKEDDELNPSSPYAWTKQAIEEYITYMNKHNGMQGIILRFANVYGVGASNQKSVVQIFIERLLHGQNILIHGDGTQTRDFIYITDLVNLCVLLTDTDITNYADAIFNVSTGSEISMNELLKKIELVSVKTAVIAYEQSIFSGQKRSLLDTKKTKNILGWNAKTSIDEGIKNILATYK